MGLSQHPRLTVSALSSWDWDLDTDLAWWWEADVRRVSIWTDKLDAAGWDAGLARIEAAGIDVGSVIGAGPFNLAEPEQWPAQRQRMQAMLDAAARLGTDLLVLTTGPGYWMDWDQAVAALAEAAGPVIAGRGPIRVAYEHTHQLRPDIGFVHSLADAIDLGAVLGAGVCMEINACWAERDLYRTIAAHAAEISVVQVDDFAVGTRDTPNRLVPGDGDIPLERIFSSLLEAGFTGDFDLEIVGPKIEQEGYGAAISRSVEWVSNVLDRLGA